MTRLRLVSVCLLLASAAPALAQGTAEDYARADSLRERMAGKVFKERIEPHWYAGNDRFWYRNDLMGGGKAFVVVDATKGERKPAFDPVKLAAALAKASGKEVTAKVLPFDRIEVVDDGAILFEAFDKGWKFDPVAGTVTEGEKLAKPPETAATNRNPRGNAGRRGRGGRRDGSPDGAWTAFVKDHNLWLRKKDGGEEFALSDDGKAGDAYESGVYWSPDSKKVVGLRTAKGDERKVYLIASSPADQLQPKLDSYPYLKPGDKVPITKPHLFDVASRKPIKVSDELYANPYTIDEFRWDADSSRFTFLFNQRGHQKLRLLAMDAESGKVEPIIDESSETFIDYSQKKYLHEVEKTGEYLWMSERDGWNHLYLYDGEARAVKNQMTKGDWVVLGVERVDDEARQVWFRAGGIHPGQDPYHVHHARVNYDGTGLTLLTEGDGTHQIKESPDRRFLIDTYSRVDLPPVTELRSLKDGKLVRKLEEADVSALKRANGRYQAPERFVAKGRDGTTDIYGIILRPTNFDPKKKYPVIEAIYAGPHGAFVPKSFAAFQRAQVTAELGFIVVQIDGMGTNWRSRAFHDVCWKNLKDAGFPDRIAWMKAAAEKEPAMDLNRVGIYGGSAGGQNAMGAVLFHGDFYKAAAADCGCHDNRMDKIWWNEAWMGWPVGPEYAASSNVVHANKLKGHLFLTVGEMDRNVDPSSTLQVVSALIKAGKDFELIVFPGGGHGAGGGRYGERRRRDFFVRHLIGVRPPERNGGAD